MLSLRVNGIYSAWMAEFGHACAHCDEIRQSDPYRIANVSYSLIQRDPAGALKRHTLVDIGMGVTQSLLDFERQSDVHVIHEILISHSHFDHVAHLDWLTNALRRNGRPDQPRPVPVYCTQPCWDLGPGRLFPWLVGGAVQHRPISPLEPLILDEIRVTPMQVEHGSTAPGAVGFIIEHPPGADSPRQVSSRQADNVSAIGEARTSSNGPTKIILTCDLLRVGDPRHPAWLDADVCFIESNTWNRNPDTGHQSILDAIDLVRLWKPKRTYLIHYSGFEDARHSRSEVSRPLTHAELKIQVNRHAPDLDIRLARHGMMLPADEPWPI